MLPRYHSPFGPPTGKRRLSAALAQDFVQGLRGTDKWPSIIIPRYGPTRRNQQRFGTRATVDSPAFGHADPAKPHAPQLRHADRSRSRPLRTRQATAECPALTDFPA